MKNLVIGSEGFVGRHLCDYLKRQGEEVVHFDIANSARQDARKARLHLKTIDRVYILAWDVGGSKYLYKKESQHFQLSWNLELLLNLMPQLNSAQVPFLFVSSQLAEECDTIYGVTKRLGEVWTNLLDGVRIRLWNIYGAAEKTNERSHVICDFIHQALKTGTIKMMTTGQEWRQFIHVEDASRAMHMALQGKLAGVYDISSFEWVKIIDVARTIGSLTKARVIPGKIVGRTPITPMKGKVPNWQPKISMEEGLRNLVTQMKLSR